MITQRNGEASEAKSSELPPGTPKKPEVSELKDMFSQSGHYVYAQSAMMVAHFISFPILTRLLSIADYGLLGLVTTTIFLVVALCKSGLQNSFIRYYDQKSSGQRAGAGYFSTFVFGPMFMCLGIVLIYVFAVNVVFGGLLSAKLRLLLSLSAPIILIKAYRILLMSFWRTEQRTVLYNGLFVGSTYLYVSFGITAALVSSGGVTAIVTGYFFAEAICFLIVCALIKRHYGASIKLKAFSRSLFRKALLYGLPLLGTEFTYFVLSAGDRYVIISLMNSRALGLYTAASNLTTNAAAFLAFPLGFAVVPIYMSIWRRKGKNSTEQFLSQVLKYYLLIALPVICGFTAVGKDLLTLLASSKYASSYVVIPFLVTGALVYSTNNIFNAGLLIGEKTMILMVLTMAAGLENIVLNIVLIGQWGLLGAAIATFISYITLMVLTMVVSAKYLTVRMDWLQIIRYGGYSLVMYLCVFKMAFSSLVLTIFVKVLCGVLVYALLILLFESDVRKAVITKIGFRFTRKYRSEPRPIKTEEPR